MNAPCLPYDVLSAARTQAIADLAANPNSRIALGKARALTHLQLMLELGARQ